MGKAADNERLRLRASFYNNVGVGALVGGVLLPYLAIHQISPNTVIDLQWAYKFLVPMALAFAVAIAVRIRAEAPVRRIKD